MKKRYYYKHKSSLLILASVITLIVVSGIIYIALRLAGLGNLSSYNYDLDITAIVVLGIIGINIIWLMFFSSYFFGKNKIYCNLGVYYQKIEYLYISNIAHSADKKILFLYWYNNASSYESGDLKNEQITQICIKDKYFDEIIDFIQQKNSSVIYEIIPSQKKEKKDEGSSGK